MKVKIIVNGTEGQETRNVDIAASGASLAEVCKAAGIETKEKDFTVDNKPATLDTHVGKNPAVEVTARPQSS